MINHHSTPRNVIGPMTDVSHRVAQTQRLAGKWLLYKTTITLLITYIISPLPQSQWTTKHTYIQHPQLHHFPSSKPNAWTTTTPYVTNATVLSRPGGTSYFETDVLREIGRFIDKHRGVPEELFAPKRGSFNAWLRLPFS